MLQFKVHCKEIDEGIIPKEVSELAEKMIKKEEEEEEEPQTEN